MFPTECGRLWETGTLRRWFQTLWTLWVDRCHSCCRPCSWTTIPLTLWHPASVQRSSSIALLHSFCILKPFPANFLDNQPIWPNQVWQNSLSNWDTWVCTWGNEQADLIIAQLSVSLGDTWRTSVGTILETWDGIYQTCSHITCKENNTIDTYWYPFNSHLVSLNSWTISHSTCTHETESNS